MKKTQLQRVEGQLLRSGYITRNQCLKVNITRLGALIQKLEYSGWEFEASYKDNDYVYKVVKSPYKKIIYTLQNGKKIETRA